MSFRRFLFITTAILLFSFNAFSGGYFLLPGEPLIRIGLTTNARNVTITTSDSSLVAYSVGEPNKFLDTKRVTVSAKPYSPSVIERYRIEIPGLDSQVEANELARNISDATGESALVSIDLDTNRWKVWIGTVKDSREEAAALTAMLAGKGYTDAKTVAESISVHSQDAVVLSQQIRAAAKSEVRSIIKLTAATSAVIPAGGSAVVPGLREVVVNGAGDAAKYSSLKAVSFGSVDERANPVRLNGKAYRGKLEVFVNSRGTLTVVNVVPLEEYLLGVVPSELSLPQLEAQKAQAVAARTYAVANINDYGAKGFDMLPTVWSQVYKGVSVETKMGTQAVNETRGMIATYGGKPIMAYYTSTCGGRTENSEHIFDKAEPYLRGVECSLEGDRHFDPFMIRSVRKPARIRNEGNVELVRLMSLLAVNGFALSPSTITDEWLEGIPTEGEVSNWLNRLAVKFEKTFPNVNKDTAKPLELARIIGGFLYTPGEADTLLSDSDINYQLSFDDAAEVPKERRAELAMLMRDGYFTLHSDMTLQPNRPFSRAKMLRLIEQIYAKRDWMPKLETDTAKPSADGKLVFGSGRSEKQLVVSPEVFLFRKFGDTFYQVKEAAIIGGEKVAYQTDHTGAIVYLEISPSDSPTVAENMSPFTNWKQTLSAATVRSRLSRYVRGIGDLYDVNIKAKGYSRRAVELEIIGSNGVKVLKGGKIRSALRLREQLFIIEKRYSGDRVTSYTFTGRGWGHGVGMCQYGAYGMAKMGVKFDEIIRHYYTGTKVTKAY